MPKVTRVIFYIYVRYEAGSRGRTLLISRMEKQRLDTNPSKFRMDPTIHKMSVEPPIKAASLKHAVKLLLEMLNELRANAEPDETIFATYDFNPAVGWDVEIVVGPTMANCYTFRDLTWWQKRRFRKILFAMFREQKTAWQKLKKIFGAKPSSKTQQPVPAADKQPTPNGKKPVADVITQKTGK